MVSISNIASAQASAYYEKDNYYSQSAGQWQGKGGELLGLAGEVRHEDFQNLVYGRDREGNQLVEGSRANGGEHRAGTDLTLSVPKSVSMLVEVVGDQRIQEAHDKAVTAALDFVEKNFSQARLTSEGQTGRVDTGNLIIAKFQHHTSRALDPQTHTHALILNMTRREDGAWRALSNEKLFESKMLIGQIYRNELAANLRELGYSIQADHKGLFEIQGIDQKVLDHFSQRSEQIDKKIAELKESGKYQGINDQKLREIAGLGSRAAKTDVDMNMVREAWAERLNSLGFTKEQLQHSSQKGMEQVAERRTAISPREYIDRAASVLAEQEAAFSKEELLKTACRLSIGEHRIGTLEGSLGRNNDVIALDNGFYTTREMLRLEREIVDRVKDGKDKSDPILSAERAAEAIKSFELKNFGLTDGQRNAALHILSTPDRAIGIQGDAGTGKTTMLTAVQEQLKANGFQTVGLAFTGKAAEEIEKNAAIRSQTIHSFLASKETISAKTVLVVDEASMIGSRQMHEIISRAEQAGARIVFIGDTKQLQAISAGNMFAKLQEVGAMKTAEMKDVLRQKEEGYKEIIKDISNKKIDSAFNKLDRQGRISEEHDRAERLGKIVQDYTARKDYREVLIVTARNNDRNDLNQAIRAELKEQGRLSGPEHTFTVRETKGISPSEKHFAQSFQPGQVVFSQAAGVYGRAGQEARILSVDMQNHRIEVMRNDLAVFRVDLKTQGQHLQAFTEKKAGFTSGERIVFLKNDKALGVKNGVTGTIENIKGEIIRATTDNGKEVSFSPNKYPYISYGYSVTDYKSQGQTVREVIYHADTKQQANYNQFYVALTRGKEDIRIYTDSKESLREQVKVAQEKTSTLDHSRGVDSEKNTGGRAAVTSIETPGRDNNERSEGREVTR